MIIDDDLSIEHLNELIATMREWSTGLLPWTRAQTAAWRLRWFRKTPEQDALELEQARERRRFDDERPRERELLHPSGLPDAQHGRWGIEP